MKRERTKGSPDGGLVSSGASRGAKRPPAPARGISPTPPEGRSFRRKRGPVISNTIGKMMEQEITLPLLKRMFGLDPGDPKSTNPSFEMVLGLLDTRCKTAQQRAEAEGYRYKRVVAAVRIVEALYTRDLAAIDRLMDRIEGKPPQRIEIAPGQPDDPETLSDEELTRIATGKDEMEMEMEMG